MKNSFSLLLCLAVFLAAGSARGSGPIGLIMDGYQTGCKVTRVDLTVQKCSYTLELYDGDLITKEPDTSSLKFQWLAAPFTHADTVNSTTLRIKSERPKGMAGLFARLGDALRFVKTPHPSGPYGTRAGACQEIVPPLPGYGATLLPGIPARFVWDGKGKTLLFKGGDGKVLFRAAVAGKSSVVLKPEAIGLRQGSSYTWEIEGIDSDELYRVRLIGKELGDMVQRDLAQIDGSKGAGAGEKTLRKAVYLQLVSDLYAKEADLYWLSIQLLGEECAGTAGELRIRYMQHQQKTVRLK